MPLALVREIDRDTRLGLWHITEPADELRGRVSLDDRQRAALARMRHGRRRHWLAGRVLLRELLGGGAAPRCTADADGRPRLAGSATRVSIAHSFDYAAAMIGGRGVGVDLELIRPEVLGIAELFMTADELAPVRDPHRIEKLCACWCAKEAVFKLRGEPDLSPKRMTVRPFAYARRGTLTVDLRGPHGQEPLRVRYERFRGYMLACVTAPPPTPRAPAPASCAWRG